MTRRLLTCHLAGLLCCATSLLATPDAFPPLLRPAVPEVDDSDGWCENVIDRFVLHRMQAKGLAPGPRADARTLGRRLWLTLVGLPADAARLERLTHSTRPDAWGRLVDAALAHPARGERLARHWLDVARFAESHGFEHDYDRKHAYHYRDFVVRAVSEDMPYDQFLRWQVAGDEYAPEDPLALMATGFLGAGVFPTQITKREVERTRYDALDDMLSTTSSAFLGLSVGCARCHDHKFDPIPARDYYRMLATFTTTVRSEMEVELWPEVQADALAEWEAEERRLRGALEAFEAKDFRRWLAERTTTLAQGSQGPRPTWSLLRVAQARSKGGATLTPQDDGAILASGKNPARDHYVLRGETVEPRLTALRLEALAHPSLPKKGPGRAPNGNIGLSRVRLRVAPRDAQGKAADFVEAKLVRPLASHEQNGDNLSIRASLEGKKGRGWAVDGQIGRDHVAIYHLEAPISTPNGAELEVILEFDVNTQHNLGRPRLSLSSRPGELGLEGEVRSPELEAALAKLRNDKRLDELAEGERRALAHRFGPENPGWRERDAALRAHRKSRPKPELVKMQVTTEGRKAMRHHSQGADFFNETFFLERGDTSRKKGVVKQGFLSLVSKESVEADRWHTPPPKGSRTSGRRRAMAEWMLDLEHGAGRLVARVASNRVWQRLFGRGLVATPNDFGAQGQKASHPELLDWLAIELVESGWNLEHLQRLILESSTWRQSSARDPVRESIDPENLTFWRFVPRRLEAEAIRDSLLFVSGLLDTRRFGPGTLNENHRRRGLYFQQKRSRMSPMLQIFDAPEALSSQPARPATVITPQSLFFLNNPALRSWAEGLALRLAKDSTGSATGPTSSAASVRRAFRLALARDPDASELATLTAFLESAIADYRGAGAAQPAELARTDLAQIIFGLNELLWIE